MVMTIRKSAGVKTVNGTHKICKTAMRNRWIRGDRRRTE
jgi:hypothetical protein